MFLDLSETNFGHEEAALHAAINAMRSSNTRKGIEERLANCEKVLRLLLLQVSLASFNSSHLEQKEEVSIIFIIISFQFNVNNTIIICNVFSKLNTE